MAIQITPARINKLKLLGVTTLFGAGFILPDETIFEPPCSIKWMNIEHSMMLGAFSYAVSGYYFGCRIGRYCSIGEQVQVGRHDHPMHWFSTSPIFHLSFDQVMNNELPEHKTFDPNLDLKRSGPPTKVALTNIGNDVWIGHGAFIMPGVTIGDGAVVGAMSVVTRDVPPYAIVVGSPAKVVRYRFSEEHMGKLVNVKWWDYAPWQLKAMEVDNIEAVIDHVEALRESGESVYTPQLIRITQLEEF